VEGAGEDSLRACKRLKKAGVIARSFLTLTRKEKDWVE